MRNSVLAALLFMMPQLADARPIPAVQSFLYQELAKINAGLAELEETTDSTEDEITSGNYAFTVFKLRIMADVGFDVGTIAKLTLVPQIELTWR